MGEQRRFGRLKLSTAMAVALLILLENVSLCLSLNSEGLALLKIRERIVRDPFGALSNWNDNEGEVDHCSWFGVKCSEGKVVVLDLRNLCLRGSLAPEIGKLTQVKAIILRNNSFYGEIPKEIGELEELEVLDMGYNNFTGSFPSVLGNNLSLTLLLLDNNEFIGSLSPELNELKTLSEFLVDQKQPVSNTWNGGQSRDVDYWRRLLAETRTASSAKRTEDNQEDLSSPTPSTPLQTGSDSHSFLSSLPSMPPSHSPSLSAPSPSFESPSQSPAVTPASSPSAPSPSTIQIPSPSEMVPIDPTPASQVLASPPVDVPATRRLPLVPPPFPVSPPIQAVKEDHKPKGNTVKMLGGITGGLLFLLVATLVLVFFRSSKVVTVKPWATGLSGQLQKAFVTGVPKLKRSELEAACEDFSNIIGSFSDGTVYKGTLSSGVEIAVTSSAVKATEDWSKTREAQFRSKIETLSRVNHKNFLNLIGFCEEEDPFTRMMVFEYAPNGTLFEHIHRKESEYLEWGARMRIAMGMAYCLEHMHQLTPPVIHRNLHSSSVYLTEDYAAKISDFSFWNEAKMGSAAMELLNTPSPDSESNVYSFGLILFEMVTGRIPYSFHNGPPADWALDYLLGNQPLGEIVDPTLSSLREEELEKLSQVIQQCVNPVPKQRPTMKEVAARLKEITAMEPDGAIPKLSPLWWAELEIMSTEGN